MNRTQTYMQYTHQIKAFPAFRAVLHHRLLLLQTAEHLGDKLRLLKEAAHEGLLMLAI